MEFSLSFILIPFTSVSFESVRSSDTGKHFADIEKNVPSRDQILDFTFICTGIIEQLVFQMLIRIDAQMYFLFSWRCSCDTEG